MDTILSSGNNYLIYTIQLNNLLNPFWMFELSIFLFAHFLECILGFVPPNSALRTQIE